jgi:hypothetical protein
VATAGAAELPKLGLADALALLLLYSPNDRRRFARAVVRWHGRLCLEVLLRDVWGFRSEPRTRTLDAHACRLRRKLGHAGAIGHVVNVRGVGYRLVDRVPELVGPRGLNGDSATGDRTGAMQRLADVA